MNVFFSWSGEASRLAADAFKVWLEQILPGVRVFFSDTDMEAGSRWSEVIANKLRDSDCGILFLDQVSINSPWVQFEAGALSKHDANALVCPILLGLSKSHVSGPLSQFQLTEIEKADVHKLVVAINNRSERPLPPLTVDTLMESLWPKLKEAISERVNSAPTPPEPVRRPVPEVVEDIDKKIFELNVGLRRILQSVESPQGWGSGIVPSGIRQMAPSTGEDFRDLIRRFREDRDAAMETLHGFQEHLTILDMVRGAGIVGCYKQREQALEEFLTKAIHIESGVITVIGSSLRGLTANEGIWKTLRTKTDLGVRVRFLLTHPIVADFRAKQEGRAPGKIGEEIIDTLELLKDWNRDFTETRLYLGTPTCFAIKTSTYILLNPYPYYSAAFEAPCLILRKTADNPAWPTYLYEEFSTHHFGAWNSDLAVAVNDFDSIISTFRSRLIEYAQTVDTIMERGHAF